MQFHQPNTMNTKTYITHKMPKNLTLWDVRLLFSISSSALSVTFDSSPWIRSRDCWAWIKNQKVPLVNKVAWGWTYNSSVIIHNITLYKSPATFCLSFSSVSSLDRVWVSWVFSWNKNRQSAHVLQHMTASHWHLLTPVINKRRCIQCTERACIESSTFAQI